MSKSIYHRKITDFQPVTFQDPNNPGKEAMGFHLTLSPDSGNIVLDMAKKAAALAEGKSSDCHIFIFAKRSYNEAGELVQDDAQIWLDLWADGKGELAKQGLDVAEMLIPSEKAFHRFWSRDVGNHKKGDIITDTSGTPITYTKVPVTILCDPEGNPLQDPDNAARRWMTRNEKDGLLKYISTSTTPTPTTTLTDDLKIQMEIALESAADLSGQAKEDIRANFETKWKAKRGIA